MQKPPDTVLPMMLNHTDTFDLESPSWILFLELYENLDLDPKDSIKIAAIRQKGLLVSAQNEKIRIQEAMQNIGMYYKNRAFVLTELIDAKPVVYVPLLWYFKKLYTNVCNNVEKSLPESQIDSSELYFTSVDDFEHVLNFASDDETCE